MLRVRIVLALLSFQLLTHSCVYNDIPRPFDCARSDFAVVIDAVNHTTDCSTNDGTIKLLTTGGKTPYEFFLNNELFQTEIFDGLSAGVYGVRVRDAIGCEISVDNIIVQAENLSFTS